MPVPKWKAQKAHNPDSAKTKRAGCSRYKSPIWATNRAGHRLAGAKAWLASTPSMAQQAIIKIGFFGWAILEWAGESGEKKPEKKLGNKSAEWRI